MAGRRSAMAMPDAVWQDREIRFDSPVSVLDLRRGEIKIDSINSVEDTQGNNGERGSLTITNLRLLWTCHRNARTNLSIGYNCVTNVKIRTAASRLRGNTQALYVMTKFNGSGFKFVFTSLVKQSPRLFTTTQAVFRAYETTKLYRDLKLRGAIIKDKTLILLPHEQVYSKIVGVWNLSSDQGNLGTFFVTNVRLVWHANLAENFNVSMPYLQMKTIKIRDSKFGRALVIETSERSGGYILGFRIDPAGHEDPSAYLNEIFHEIQSLWQVFSVNPIFGIDYTVEEKPEPTEAVKVPTVTDDVEIVDEGDGGDVFAAYYADSGKETDRAPEFNEELGLAVEAVREGLSLKKLWSAT